MIRDKHLGLRIDEEMHRKLTLLAKIEGRSVNAEVRQLIFRAIREYEKEYGELKESEE
ncbi:MAG: type II toxin-antitoxin system HicB family antitoxin [Eubacterium sp.]|nr:type II toxin-antitoxin system HicB family antitoxin [Eubacterium sp.]